MQRSLLLSATCAFVLIGCSQSEEQSSSSEAVGAGAESSGALDVAAQPEAKPPMTAPLPAAMPKLAYRYSLAFELPSNDIGKLMRRHADLCEQQGPSSCRIVGMDLSGDTQRNDIQGTLQLAVAAPHARALTALMEKESDSLGAEQTATTIGSEEVSKTVVDTEARIRARVALRERLTDVLRNSRGSVKDLVEAERQVAAVNEEIDQARSWLAETQGRVAFSRMDIDYRAAVPIGSSFLAPVKAAVGALGGILGFILAAALVVGAAIGPVVGFIWAGKRLARRFAPKTTET